VRLEQMVPKGLAFLTFEQFREQREQTLASRGVSNGFGDCGQFFAKCLAHSP